MKDVFATLLLESDQKHGRFRLIFYQRDYTDSHGILEIWGLVFL